MRDIYKQAYGDDRFRTVFATNELLNRAVYANLDPIDIIILLAEANNAMKTEIITAMGKSRLPDSLKFPGDL